jgi:N-acetylglucosaminyldiphosphoundecaprenol N-acetyl-beta-D-mannosaminyltransferase
MELCEVKFTNVGGLKTACISRRDLVNLMVNKVKSARLITNKDPVLPMVVFSTNGHSISIANRDQQMGKLLNQADLLHADGQSVVTLSKYFSEHPIPERSATTDTIHDIPQTSNETIKHFLLGASQPTIDKCATILSSQYANFKIAGTHHGFFNDDEEKSLI